MLAALAAAVLRAERALELQVLRNHVGEANQWV
jgi:hypothetical protein